MKRDRTDTDTEAELTAADATHGQRRVRDALRALDVPAPDTLRLAVEHEVAAALRRRGVRHRLGAFSGAAGRARGDGHEPSRAQSAAPRRLGARSLALAGGGLAVLALALAFVLSSGGSDAGLSVQQASRVALSPAAAPPPAARPGGTQLMASVDGIAYPTWTHVGWKPVGERSDTLAGHRIRTVFYANPGGWRVGYAIAAGDALPVPSGGRVFVHHGTQLHLLAVDGATVVTWRRDGHTCILASKHAAPASLLKLAGYAT